MKIAPKLIICAILSISIGIAAATPLLITEIVPFAKIPQGPTANFGVGIVYANFAVQKATSQSEQPQVNYQVILNITNLSDIAAKLGTLNFAAAQNITIIQGASEEATASTSGHGNEGGHFGTVVEGLWLDNEWLNVTWIPGTHPDGLAQVMSDYWGSGDVVGYISKMPTVIPNLPANASKTGYYMEGVPIKQYHYINSTSNALNLWDTIYVNGTWVNVTGRIRIPNPVVSVLEYGTFIQATTVFTPQNSFHGNQSSNSSIHETVVVLTGDNGFNNTWVPHQSRLIQMIGTVTMTNRDILNSFTNEDINLYAATYNYVYDQPVNGTFYDTSTLTTQLKAISLAEASDGNYVYNTVLNGNETFQFDKYGIEVFITPRS